MTGRATAYAAALRLAHAFRPDLRLPDPPVRQSLDGGRPLRESLSTPAALRSDGRHRSCATTACEPRRRRSHRRRRVRREHRATTRFAKARSPPIRRPPGVRRQRCASSAGLRADYYDFDVGTTHDAGAATVSGKGTMTQLSRRRSAIGLVPDRQRRAVRQLGPRLPFERCARRGEHRTSPVPGLVNGTGYEGGVRFEVGRLQRSPPPTGGWNVDSELIFVGDSNAVEPKIRRQAPGLRTGGVLATGALAGHRRGLHAQPRALQRNCRTTGFRRGDPALSRLQGTHRGRGRERRRVRHLRRAGQLGSQQPACATSAPTRWFPSNTQARGRRDHGQPAPRLQGRPRSRVYGELLNVLDDQGNDIEYYYPTYVPGVTAARRADRDPAVARRGAAHGAGRPQVLLLI